MSLLYNRELINATNVFSEKSQLRVGNKCIIVASDYVDAVLIMIKIRIKVRDFVLKSLANYEV